MDIVIDFALVTVPTPEPYDKTLPTKQQENLAYVALQVCAQAQAQGVKLAYTDDADNPRGLLVNGSTLAIQDLRYNGQMLDAGAFKLVFFNKALGIEGKL